MKKTISKKSALSSTPEIRSEYDFSGGVRGKYTAAYAKGGNIVRLDPEVSKAFPDSASVNEALRTAMKTAKRTRRLS